MSQNNSQKGKFQGFPGNQTRGHTEFGQAGYPQQYQFPPGALSGVPQANELSKQVQAAQQQGMYAGSTTQAQQSMGPSASPQQQNPMNAQQQQQQHLGRTAHVTAMPGYYARSNVVPRTLQGMGRAPLTTVVNQGGGGGTSTGQQPPSTPQYSHAVQMVPSHPFHHPSIQPIIVNTHHHQLTAQQMYPQRTYSPQQYSVIPGQQIYLNNHQWGNYSNVTASNSNGYYPPHQVLSSFNAMPPQLPPQMGGSQQPTQSQPLPPAANRKNPLPIIDPTTGKNILDGLNQESITPPRATNLHEKETENADPNICVQFATQVAAALANNDKNDISAKGSSIMDTRVIPDAQLCPVEPPEEETYQSRSRPEPFYEIDTGNPEEEPYQEESPSVVGNEPEVVPEPDPLVCDEVCQEEVPVMDADDIAPVIDSSQEKSVGFCNVQELNKVNAQLSMDIVNVSHESTAQPMPVVESHKEPPVIEEKIETINIANTSKQVEKLSSIDSKKNKARKKKDLNKKGESKEGGEMDAFLDKGPEEEHVPSVLEEQRSLSPVPVVDSDVLDSIPLPPEPAPSPPNGEKASEDKENSPVEDAASKLILKYEYKEDQWSPLNPEGKKQYDRDFLLQLQGEPMSLCKPSNLPNLDVIKDKAHIQKLTEVNRVMPMTIPMKAYNDPFVPTYARGGAQRPPHPSIGRRSQQGGRGPEKPKKVISFSSSLNQAVKLHESENAWKPHNQVHKQEVAIDDNPETQELYRKVRGILNKLTPQKFETLVEQVKGLDITTEEKLNGVIDLVFEKAIDEPNFSVPYANMCKQLVKIKVPVADQPGQHVNFRKLLLTKCQKEFEQDTRDELKREEKLKAIEVADQDKKKELQFEFDEEEKKMRYRQLGNIRFIGELFKLNMLTEPIMHDCIHKLLRQGDEESLECLCRLLKTIGKELESNPDGKQQQSSRGNVMETYFSQMQKIVDKRLTSSRVRFMLQDVIDLKRNNWVPRRDENNPKTIDQIHKEVEKEAREQQQSYQNMPASSSAYPKRMNTDDRRKGMNRNIGMSEDGWIPSSNKSNKGSYMVDPTKLKLTKPDEVESMRLGPGGRGLQSWGRGSSGGTKMSPAEEKASAALTNRYSALADQAGPQNLEGRRGSQRSAASSRESSRGRSGPGQQPPAIRKTSSSKERAIENVKGLNRTSQPTQEPRVVVQPTESTIKRAAMVEEQRTHMNGKMTERDALMLRGPELNEEELEKKTKPLIDEFLHNADYEEAIKCVTELCSPATVHLFIEAAVNQVLERSSQARTLLGQLFYLLISRQIFTLQQYKKGLGRVLSNIDEYALDIPLIWDYTGEILEPMVEDNKLPLSFLKEVLEPCRPSLTAGKLVSAVLCSAKKKGTVKLGEAWRESGLQWTDFLGTSESIEDFVHTHKLEFTVTPTKTSLSTELSPEEQRKELSSLLQNNKNNEDIFDWIDANVSPKAVTEASFIRALVSAVHENAIHGSGQTCELVQTKLKERIPLLTRYIEHKENLELQALYAIQSLMNQLDQPKGVLRQIFDLLYDDDVINDDTFKRWEQSNDPDEMEGKGVALLSVSPFFTWLREAESGDSDPPEEEPLPT